MHCSFVGLVESYCGHLIFRHSPVAPWGGGDTIWPILRTTPLKYNSYQTTSKPYHVLQNTEILHPSFSVH